MNETRSSFRRTFCRLCPAACGMLVEVAREKIVTVRGDKSHPLSQGYLCPKGLAAGKAHHSDRRLDQPLIQRDNGYFHAQWAETLQSIGERLSQIRSESGPDSIGTYFGTAAFFDSGAQVARTFTAQLPSRSWYTPSSVDAAGWLLVAERMSGNAWLLPQPDPDAELAILIGINPVISHGHNFYTAAPKTLLRDWAGRKGLWVVDPRLTETAAMATEHFRLVPGSEYWLLGYLVKALLENGADEEFLAKFASNRDRLEAAVAGFTLEAAVRHTGVPIERINVLLAAIRDAGRIAVHSGTGVSMSRHANITTWLLWTLNIVTGSMDRPGGMWFNRGMMNDWNATGWEPVDTSEPGPPSRPDLPRRVGEMPSVALVSEIEAGNLRALLVIGGNPVIALPETDRLKRALGKLDLLVVMDVVPTGTTELATHILPCSGQFERSDLSLSEIIYPKEMSQFTPAMVPPSNGRRPVWWIIGQIARALGMDIAPAEYNEANDRDMTGLVAGSARFDVSRLVAGEGGWHSASERCWGWVDRHLPNGKWDLAPRELVDQLCTTEPVAALEPESFFLLARRQRHKVNSTFNDGVADPHDRSPAGLYIHPTDASRLGLKPAGMARVISPVGSLMVRVQLDDTMLPGCVSLPHGFEDGNVGALTSANVDVDILSGMPTLTGLKIHIECA